MGQAYASFHYGRSTLNSQFTQYDNTAVYIGTKRTHLFMIDAESGEVESAYLADNMAAGVYVYMLIHIHACMYI